MPPFCRSFVALDAGWLRFDLLRFLPPLLPRLYVGCYVTHVLLGYIYYVAVALRLLIATFAVIQFPVTTFTMPVAFTRYTLVYLPAVPGLLPRVYGLRVTLHTCLHRILPAVTPVVAFTPRLPCRVRSTVCYGSVGSPPHYRTRTFYHAPATLVLPGSYIWFGWVLILPVARGLPVLPYRAAYTRLPLVLPHTLQFTYYARYTAYRSSLFYTFTFAFTVTAHGS